MKCKKRMVSKAETTNRKEGNRESNDSPTNVQNSPNIGEKIRDYFSTHTDTARGCAIALNIFRDCFSSRLPRWVKDGVLAIPYDGRDKCTNRRVHYYTADPKYITLLHKEKCRQLSFSDIEGFDEKGGMS